MKTFDVTFTVRFHRQIEAASQEEAEQELRELTMTDVWLNDVWELDTTEYEIVADDDDDQGAGE